MGVLSGIEPQLVFQYFEEICNIPHGSGNVEQISDYLKKFAEDRGLFCIQDEVKNIIIKKKGSIGYEEKEPVILQGHMDMVAVKKPEETIDMTSEPLRLALKEDRVYAKGTSLGGDDGIAVAFALALLDDDSIAHPPLEIIITTDEETGMDGAREIDLSCLEGKRMLNLDSEEEGILLVSCAGGSRVNTELPVEREKEEKGLRYSLIVDGLQGGHSGTEIHKGRLNSNHLMMRVLNELLQKGVDCRLVTMQGGLADNAIPRRTEAILDIIGEDSSKTDEASEKNSILADVWQEVVEILKKEYQSREPQMKLVLEPWKEGSTTLQAIGNCLTKASMQKVVQYVLALPNGVMAMSVDVPGLVETSLNLGIMELNEKALCTETSVRSNIDSAKAALLQKLAAVSNLAGAKVSVKGDYPGWSYRKDSPLREKMVEVYERMYGEKPQVEALHAGLECGLLSAKIQDLDCVSFGPNIHDIHTTEEELEIASTKRCWEYVLEILKEL